MLRTTGGLARVRASQEFAEGPVLGLAERVSEISDTVRTAGESGECSPSSCVTAGDNVDRGSRFLEQGGSNR